QNGDWSMFSDIDLSCASSIDARVSSRTAGGNIEVRADSITGTLLATIPVETTNSWTTYNTVSADVMNTVSGTHDVYVVFTGGNGYLMNLNWIEFSSDQAKNTGTIPSDNALLIYPNPVKNKFIIKLNNSLTTKYTIKDATGKIIVTGTLNEGTTSINASSLTPGLYLIKATNDYATYTGKLIKE
ncbi:carbohydrate-binding protein, partial [Aquimarina pacifica]|uniref:carbohydrate-binding protein n=1 Tax=Aquimarina pacifica TaxID=1296415 RepID=UPI001268F127